MYEDGGDTQKQRNVAIVGGAERDRDAGTFCLREGVAGNGLKLRRRSTQRPFVRAIRLETLRAGCLRTRSFADEAGTALRSFCAADPLPGPILGKGFSKKS